MYLNIKFGKTEEDASRMIKYAFGRRGRKAANPGREIRWESWNFYDNKIEISSVIPEWIALLKMRDMARTRNQPKKGRPGIKSAVMFSLNDDAHMDFFKFMREAIWEWVEKEFSSYMGIIAYHMKQDKFHSHIIVNPVSLIDKTSMLRITGDDEYYKNMYIDFRNKAIARGISAFSREIAKKTGRPQDEIIDDGVITLPMYDGGLYSEMLKKSSKEVLGMLAERKFNQDLRKPKEAVSYAR